MYKLIEDHDYIYNDIHVFAIMHVNRHDECTCILSYDTFVTYHTVSFDHLRL